MRHAELHRGQDVGDGHRAGVVGVQRPLDAWELRHQVLERSRDLARVRHAGRVGQADGAGADVDQPAHDALDLRDRHLGLERASERRRDAAGDGDAGSLGHLHDGAQLLDRLGDRHVDVREVVALTGRDNRVDGVDTGVHGADRALVVGNERRVAGGRAAADLGHHLLGVTRLGHHLGVDERRHLDALEAGCGQEVDDLDLLFRGDELGLDLEAIPRSHLTNRDAIRQLHGHPPLRSELYHGAKLAHRRRRMRSRFPHRADEDPREDRKRPRFSFGTS